MKNVGLIIGGSILLALIIIGVVISMLGLPQNIVPLISGTTLQQKSVDWNGLNLVLRSPYFGSASSGGSIPATTVGVPDPGLIAVCGKNDAGDVQISNGYSLQGNTLLLTSAISGAESDCNDNGINVEAVFPAGSQATFQCQLSASTPSTDSPGSCAICFLNGQEKAATKSCNTGVSYTGTYTREYSETLTFTTDTTVKLEISTSKSYKGGSDAQMTIIYTKPLQNPTPSPSPSPGVSPSPSPTQSPGGSDNEDADESQAIWFFVSIALVVALIWAAVIWLMMRSRK